MGEVPVVGVVLPAMALDDAELAPLLFGEETVCAVGDVAGDGAGERDEAVLIVGVLELLGVVDLGLELERGHAQDGGGHFFF